MIRVFLVDDHQIVREGLKKLLLADDIEVVGEAESAEEALLKISVKKPDVVLLDIALSGKRGLDIIREIKEMREETFIIMLSMYQEKQFAMRAFKLGADGYLTKGSAPTDVLVAIRRVMKGKKYVSESLADDFASMLGDDGTFQEGHHTLSEREMSVFMALVHGKTLKQIAEDMSLSINTVSTYQTRVLLKLKVNNTVELVHYAFQAGLIP